MRLNHPQHEESINDERQNNINSDCRLLDELFAEQEELTRQHKHREAEELGFRIEQIQARLAENEFYQNYS